jgi:hypothetical protein
MSAIWPKAHGRALTGIANSGNNANGMPLEGRLWNGTTITLEDGVILGDYDVPFDVMLDFEEPFMVREPFPQSDPGVTRAKNVSQWESCGIVTSPTSAGVAANVPRRDESVGPINKAKGCGFMEYTTVEEQPPINAVIEHYMHTISALAVLQGISFLIIGYAMGANVIHSNVANVPEGLLLIGLTLTAKRKRMLATNREGRETIGCTSGTCSEMGTFTLNNFMNGTATSTCNNVLLCVLLFPHHVCKQ